MHRDSSCRVLAPLIDGLLEATVVFSFTDIGPMVRSRLFDWQDLDALRMDGRVVLITGGSSDSAARRPSDSASGASVRLLVRDPTKGERSERRSARCTPSADVEIYTSRHQRSRLGPSGDGADPRARIALAVLLVNNAGALLPERRLSVDGFEMTFATMVLGPFTLTQGLGDLLARARPRHTERPG